MHDQVVQIKDQDDDNVYIPCSVKELIANPVLFTVLKSHSTVGVLDHTIISYKEFVCPSSISMLNKSNSNVIHRL